MIEDHLTVIEDHLTVIEDHFTALDDQFTALDDHITALDDQITAIDDQLTALGGLFAGILVNVVITPTTPDKPEQLQVRVQLRKNNQNYGQLSDVVSVTVNP